MEPLSSTYNLPASSVYQTRRLPERASMPGDPRRVDDAEAHMRPQADAGRSGVQSGFQATRSGQPEFIPYSGSKVQSGSAAKSDGLKEGGASAASASEPGVQTSVPAVGGNQQDAKVQAEVARLKAVEEKVKSHEAAHKSAGGTLTGPVSYTYTRGPDGRSYITGGEVPISVTPGKTPQETISRMQQVIQAALAPADPSPQDRAVAAQAAAQQQQARQATAVASSAETPSKISYHA